MQLNKENRDPGTYQGIYKQPFEHCRLYSQEVLEGPWILQLQLFHEFGINFILRFFESYGLTQTVLLFLCLLLLLRMTPMCSTSSSCSCRGKPSPLSQAIKLSSTCSMLLGCLCGISCSWKGCRRSLLYRYRCGKGPCAYVLATTKVIAVPIVEPLVAVVPALKPVITSIKTFLYDNNTTS